jgi:hypothetical protein
MPIQLASTYGQKFTARTATNKAMSAPATPIHFQVLKKVQVPKAAEWRHE